MNQKKKGMYKEKTQDVFVRDVSYEWLLSNKSFFKESTYCKYYTMLRLYIIPQLGDYQISDMNRTILNAFCNQALKEGGQNHTPLSSKTVSDCLALLRSIFKYAKTMNYPVDVDGKEIQIKVKPKVLQVFTIEEQRTLVDYISQDITKYHLGIMLSLFTGARIGEICALRWEDISYEHKTIMINHTMQRVLNLSDTSSKTKILIDTPKSACSIRKIPIPSILLQYLLLYQTAESGFVLTNHETEFLEPRNLQYHYKRILKECQIPYSNFHTLRHTFATRCVELGFDVKSLSEILGHSSVQITMNRYVHPSMELKKEQMERLSSLFEL